MDNFGDLSESGYGGFMVRRGLGLLAALLVTVSCGGNQKGATPPPPVAAAPSATATPTPSATPFVSSADQAGAFAFTRAYFDELNRAFASGATTTLATFRKPSCSCTAIETTINETYGQGGRITGQQAKVEGLSSGETGPSFFKVTAELTVTPGRAFSRAGEQRDLQGVQGNYYLLLTRDGDHWVIDSVATQVSPVNA